MQTINHQEIEKKWTEKWLKSVIYKTPENVDPAKKQYILPQLPYPSGSGLHVGHAEVYTACDIYARYQRMIGKQVLQVIGWDAFGLPAENFAIKTNIHPRINTDKAIENFKAQITALGASVDWDRTVGSHNPDYYKWTQWFFLLMYDRGLAYRKKQAVNWCDSCKTVLANEQVVNGHCERCDTEIVQKDMEQWFLKITEYADRLSADLDKIDWPAETIKRQKDWIGRSEGALVKFEIKLQESGIRNLESDKTDRNSNGVLKQVQDRISEDKTTSYELQTTKFLEVFTTAHDTIFGATFVVLAPEHEMLQELQSQITNWAEVNQYIQATKFKTELDRQQEKVKTGIKLDGVGVINPMTNEEIPIFVADYVLGGYGTGAIMAVPGHDERDFEFAEKYHVPIKYLVAGAENKFLSYSGDIKGNTDKYHLINSGEFNGQSFTEARPAILKKLEDLGVAKAQIQFKLRDWSVSRQRFWGAPLPMIKRMAATDEEKTKFSGNPEKVVQLHAWGSKKSEHFHQWLKDELAKLKIESVIPDLPEPYTPIFNEWLKTAMTVINQDLENQVLIGRSLSTWTALKIAESVKLRKLILLCPVSPVDAYIKGIKKIISEQEVITSIENFIYQNQIDLKKVQENCGEIVIFLSTNDPYIPFVETEKWFRENLPFARIFRVKNAGHFNADAGYSTFPTLLKEVLAEVRPDLRRAKMDDLPVILPDDVDFKPTGQSPLTYSPHFQDGVAEKYGNEWSREVDTLDTFMCSSWYYFRYLDPKNDQAFASEKALKTWMPVDFYLGGPEHVNGHLLYSRFFTKVLFDAGYIDFDEPFTKHRHQGMILGEDHRKMSKRWGNVINPTDVVEKYGADTIRIYEMFMGPLEQSKAWSDAAVRGVRRFLDRVYTFSLNAKFVNDSPETEVELHKMLAKVTNDTAELHFNTAVSEFMKFLNYVEAHNISEKLWKIFILSLAPYAPFLTEEIWQTLWFEKQSIHLERWPKYDESLLGKSEIQIAVQINGKVRGKINISSDTDEAIAMGLAHQEANVEKYLNNAIIKKVVYVPGKILNVII
ncbi:MAG: class I tRNA ligase family protein [bacterium]